MATIQDKSYYEERGQSRQSITTSKEHAERLKAVATQHKLSIGEVIEVALDAVNFDSLAEQFQVKRAGRAKDGRGRSAGPTKAELLKKMKGLTPEKIAAIEAIISK